VLIESAAEYEGIALEVIYKSITVIGSSVFIQPLVDTAPTIPLTFSLYSVIFNVLYAGGIDTDDEDNLAHGLPSKTLSCSQRFRHAYVRDEIGVVRDNVQQSAVVEILVSAVRETQLEKRGLKVLMKTMTEKIDGLTEDNRALRVQILVPDIAAAASSIGTYSPSPLLMSVPDNLLDLILGSRPGS